MRGLSIACLLALSGCALPGGDDADVSTVTAEMEPAYVCEDLTEWPLYVAAQPVDVVVAALRLDRNLAEQFIKGGPQDYFSVEIQIPEDEQRSRGPTTEVIRLSGLGIDLSPEELTELLLALNDSPRSSDYQGNQQSSGEDKPIEVPPALQGIGGLSTTLVLERLLPLDGDPLGNRVLSGKIRDYAFDDDAKRGHISVDTCIDVAGAQAPGTSAGEFIHWDIDVAKGGFVVDERVEPDPPHPTPPDVTIPEADAADYPDNPFPAISLAFPDFSLDANDERGIWQRGLDHKLHASKEVMTVTDIYYRKLVGTPDEVTLRRLPDTTEPDTDERYINNADSCVDLLTRGRPPGTFAELAKLHEQGNGYCLGRCTGTPIVNSGE